MNKDLFFLKVAHAATEASAQDEAQAQETGTGTTTEPEAEHAAGLSIDPAVVGWQAFNFLVLVVILNLILYKPLTKMLDERSKRIKEGVENAEKADLMIKESETIRTDMIKTAKVESQSMMDAARKSAEKVKTEIVGTAHQEAEKIINQGRHVIEGEREKVEQELKTMTVNLVVKAAEKILKEKLDPSKDAKLIEESLKSTSV